MTLCKCKKIRNGFSRTLKETPHNVVELLKTEDYEYYIKICNDEALLIKIQYCPFCGRKLGINES